MHGLVLSLGSPSSTLPHHSSLNTPYYGCTGLYDRTYTHQDLFSQKNLGMFFSLPQIFFLNPLYLMNFYSSFWLSAPTSLGNLWPYWPDQVPCDQFLQHQFLSLTAFITIVIWPLFIQPLYYCLSFPPECNLEGRTCILFGSPWYPHALFYHQYKLTDVNFPRERS